MLHRHNLLKGRCLLWRIHGHTLAESYTAMVILDHMFMHLGYQKIKEAVGNGL